ncbi:hypothetical protein BpHYR1_000815 [Brachionus plicatilis]|uniref:Uncharacterized protein n=1 Tax=Brachionus plicatilis TaxID=10195 RepID=A0A3M7RIV3_BRAPC|nr:hypothetical protein BpHYR1_000815 [Brachionus plicatilis]
MSKTRNPTIMNPQDTSHHLKFQVNKQRRLTSLGTTEVENQQVVMKDPKKSEQKAWIYTNIYFLTFKMPTLSFSTLSDTF